MTDAIEIRGLDEIRARMKALPQKFTASARVTMNAALLTLWGNVPPYPSEPPDSDYDRTGLLGRTLGAGESGGKAGGKPDIYEIKELGGGFQGQFGTALEYGPYVIGDDTQAWMHKGRWWQMKDIAAKSQDQIVKLFGTMAEKLAKYLDGKGL